MFVPWGVQFLLRFVSQPVNLFFYSNSFCSTDRTNVFKIWELHVQKAIRNEFEAWKCIKPPYEGKKARKLQGNIVTVPGQGELCLSRFLFPVADGNANT